MADAKTTEPAVYDAKQLPNLSPSEFRVYDHMAEHMNYYVSVQVT